MQDPGCELRPIGRVESPLTDGAAAPKQGHEGSPDAWLVIDGAFRVAARDLRAGTAVIVLTWLDRARRDVLEVHPRDDLAAPLRGVFSTRSQDRPNPIGLHRVRIVEIVGLDGVDGIRLRVADLEALDGTAVLDIKPVLDPTLER